MNMSIYRCELCEVTTNRKANFERHIDTKKHRIRDIEQKEKDLAKERAENAELKKLLSQNEGIISELNIKKQELSTALDKERKNERTILIQKETIIRHEQHIRDLLEQIDCLKQIAAKPIAINNNYTNNQNKTTNNILNYLSPEPINLDDWKDRFSEVANPRLIARGSKAFYQNVLNTLFKDENKQLKVICTDRSRKNFKWKNDKGQVITDPGLVHFISYYQNMFKINLQRLSKEILEYAEENCLQEDFIQDATEMSRTSQLTRPDFSDYLAKKTYKGSLSDELAKLQFID